MLHTVHIKTYRYEKGKETTVDEEDLVVWGGTPDEAVNKVIKKLSEDSDADRMRKIEMLEKRIDRSGDQ